jgi:hypothetical protein
VVEPLAAPFISSALRPRLQRLQRMRLCRRTLDGQAVTPVTRLTYVNEGGQAVIGNVRSAGWCAEGSDVRVGHGALKRLPVLSFAMPADGVMPRWLCPLGTPIE